MTPPRKRGGQQGNRNAIKHGFYSRQFDPTDLADLVNIDDPAGLDAEIALMRVLIRRLVQSSRTLTDFESLSQVSRAITFATLAFTRLMRTRFLIVGKTGGKSEALIEASRRLMAAHAAEARAEKEAAAAGLPYPPPDPFFP